MKILVVFLLSGCGLLLANSTSEPEKHEDYNYIFSDTKSVIAIKKQLVVERVCPELFSTSMDIECFIGKNSTRCDEPMPDGAIAKFKCKDSYYISSMLYTEVTCNNGKWDKQLFNCNPDCGKKTSQGTPLVIRGGSAAIGDFPWHVGLYFTHEDNLLYICGGSILSPKLVITAAHCFGQSLQPRDYHVTAGKIFREWKHFNDKHAQYRDVVEIIIPREYKAEKTGFAADIAILVLDQVFVLSNLILPVCVDPFAPDLGPIDEIFGKVAGWGLTEENGELSERLQYATLPLINHDKCLATVPDDFTQHVTLDKICAGYTNGTSVCEGDSGGGLVHARKTDSNETLHYLIGIVSTSPFKEDSCHSFQYTTFTSVDRHIQWVNVTSFQFENWSPYDYGCILPDPPTFGTYVQLNTDPYSTKELKPGDLVAQYTKLKYFCDPGFEIQGQNLITCKEKVWNILNQFPTCFRTCPKLSALDLDIKYLYEYTKKSTDDSVLHETRAVFRCKDNVNYELEEPGYNLTTCRDGRWTRPLLKCVSTCGRNDGINSIPSEDVQIAREGQYPWHVGVYENVNTDFNLKCAGTLLSPFVVIIDSDCVDSNILHRYLVIAGTTNYSSYRANENVERSPIFKLIREDQKTILSSELLVLKRRLLLSKFIRPVCLVQPDVRSSKSLIEVPYWEEGDYRLKTKIVEETPNCDPRHLYCAVNVLKMNRTNVIFGRLVRLSDTNKGKRYYVLGYQSVEQYENNASLKITFFRDTTFIQNAVRKYNVKSAIMSECVMPRPPPNVDTNDPNPRAGDVVLEASTISYTCRLSEHETYNSSSIFCTDSKWLNVDDVPHCLTCGTSNLFESARVLSVSDSPHFTNKGEFPWLVALYNKTHDPPYYFCTGTLVTTNIVLTDGKCVTEFMTKRYINEHVYVVQAGVIHREWNFTKNLNAQNAEIHEIIFSGIISPVAALILNKRLEVTRDVAPVCLDTRGIISKSVKAPFPIYTAYWTYLDPEATPRSKFMVLNKRFVDGKLVDLVVVNSTYCPDNDYWKQARGSGSALKVMTNGQMQFYIDGLFSFSDCNTGKFFYRSLRSIMNELMSIIANKNYKG